MILILPIAVSLGLDAFSVAMGASVFPTEDEGRRAFRLVFHFGLFQGGMALLGWLVGRSIEPIIADYDHWVAFLLLAYVGLALSGSEILYPSLIIGLVAAVMTYIGLRIGHGLGLRFGHRVQIVGGLVLIFIGVRVVLSHLAA
jgi:putative Mn2+ efflux pump MntP